MTHLKQEPGPRAEDPMGQAHVSVEAPKRCRRAQHTSPSPGLTRATEKKAMPRAERMPDIHSLLIRSHEPGACSCFKAPSQTQTFCLILKAFIKADALSCTAGYLKLCSAEPGGVTKFGIQADLGGCTPSISTRGWQRDRTRQLAQLCPACYGHTGIRAQPAPDTLPPCHGTIN